MDPSESSNSQAADAAPAGQALGAARPQRRTLPPPEWLGPEGPHSAASGALNRYALGAPVARRGGGRAELEALAARMASAHRVGDEAMERETAAALARALSARGAELDLAAKLGRRALLLADEPELREELAGWFSMLGEPALAAATLRPLLSGRAGPEAVELLSRIGTLLLRAGEARAARDILEQALHEASNDPLPAELSATLGAWSADTVPGDDAALLHLEAAERRARLGERAAAFENVLRAFQMAPELAVTAERLSRMLLERGRAGASDEVRREHARRAGPGGRAAHLRRLRDAFRDEDLPRALGAALDAHLDAEVDLKGVLDAFTPQTPEATATGSVPVNFDDLLDRLGLHDLLAARLELACDLLSGSDRAKARVALGNLYLGPLARPERAVEAFLEALVVDPANEAARRALYRHAGATRDYSPLVEALVRIVEGSGAAAERMAGGRELFALAQERMQDASLALWALDALRAIDASASEVGEVVTRLKDQLRLSDDVIEESRTELAALEGASRIEALSRHASLLLSRPDNADVLLPLLLELVESAPEERSFQIAVERVLTRQGRTEELETFYERVLERADSAAERARLRVLYANVRRRSGNLDGALNLLAPVLDEAGSFPAAHSMIVLLAAQKGDELMRARALLRLGTVLTPPLRAVLSAFAGEALLREGLVDEARQAVDQALLADPSLARALSARAAVGATTQDRWGAEAMERAMAVVVPRAEICAALSRAYDRLDEPELAFAYCLRRIALRPGDLDAVRERVERSIASGDGARLGDTLSWVLAQPLPLADLAESIARALRILAPLEPARCAALARGALDVLGPRSTDLRLAALAVADVVGERGLAIATIERWLASGAPSGDRAELLLDLSRRRRAAGDADGAARALMRAMREGAWATSVLAELDVALPARTSDGEVALLFARAEALSALSEADQRGTARAWRELGAAYFDLVGDERSALHAWERAVALDPEHGIENFAADAVTFAGPDAALSKLEELAARREDPAEAARVLGVAASIALEIGRGPAAFAFALRALELDPSRTDVLAVAESAAEEKDLDAIEELYGKLADASLGRYGERAVHYRAARQLERRHSLDRALGQAIRAFEAVPSQGVVFATMARLAHRVAQTAEVVRAIERVAAADPNPNLRAEWLKRASLMAGPSEEGLRQSVEVLLRALLVRPDLEILSALGQAVTELAKLVPEEREILQLRLERGLDSVLPQLTGPAGASFALAGARWMLEAFGAVAPALRALERAVANDPSRDAYAELFPFAEMLSEATTGFVEDLLERSGKPDEELSSSLLELGARLAEAGGHNERAARLFLEAARRDPNKSELSALAEQAVRSLGNPELIARALESLILRDRAGVMVDLAHAVDAAGDAPRAIEILEEARALDGLSRQSARASFERLSSLYRSSGQSVKVEALLESEFHDEVEEVPRRVQLASELAAMVSERGEDVRAMTILELALRDAPYEPTLLLDFVRLSRRAGDSRRLGSGLSRLLEAKLETPDRLSSLRELAELHERASEWTSASERWAEVLALDPNDAEAIAALEREAERSGDYEALVKLLGRRAGLANRVDEVRRIRLRRATVLEQRLGRADEARLELEALTTATGDHLSVLRVLADLSERLGTPLRAAPLWLRASAVTEDRQEAADLSCRACDAYIAGGDLESARRVLDGVETWSRSERVLALAVEIERRRENPLARAEALDALASLPALEPERRASLLIEAAQASLGGGFQELALSRAARAAGFAPRSAAAQLLWRWLAYQQGGVGSSEQARSLLADLFALNEQLTPEQAELASFLVAEALETLEDPNGSLRELETAEDRHGVRPLIALGLGERLSRRGELARALPYFDAALGGDLRGLRGRGKVAWHAAEVARTLGSLDRAAGYLEVAAEDLETRQQANALIREIFSQRMSAPPAGGDHASTAPPPGQSRRAGGRFPSSRVSGRPTESVPSERALSSLGRYSEHPPPDTAEERVRLPSARPASLPPGPDRSSPQPSRMPAGSATSVFESQPPFNTAEPFSSVPRLSKAPSVAGRYSLRPESEEPLPRAPSFAPPRASYPPVLPAPVPSSPPPSPVASPPRTPSSAPAAPPDARERAPAKTPALDLGEAELFTQLSRGSFDSGRALVERLEPCADRTHELVSVCRRLLAMQPTDVWALGRLKQAATGDKNLAYARAIEHVLSVVDPGARPVEPPALSDQIEQPEQVRMLLMREYVSPAFEALALVWEGAEHVFRRDPSTYGITGLERIPLVAPTPLARLYASAARALGTIKTPLFQRRSAGAVTVSLALLSPPAVVVSGDVQKESPELGFRLGALLLASTHQFALLLGSPESQARAVLRGLAFAFGPPQPTFAGLGAVPNLAEVLWESIPARLQRRLRELCDDPKVLDYEAALTAARGAVRLAGLYTSGDLGVALRETCMEDGISEEALKSKASLEKLCSQHASIRSLILLASSPEYAEVRWQPGRGLR